MHPPAADTCSRGRGWHRGTARGRGHPGHRQHSQGTAGLLGSTGSQAVLSSATPCPRAGPWLGQGEPTNLPSSSELLQGFLWPRHRRLLPYVVTSSHAPLPPGHGTAGGTRLQTRAQHHVRPQAPQPNPNTHSCCSCVKPKKESAGSAGSGFSVRSLPTHHTDCTPGPGGTPQGGTGSRAPPAHLPLPSALTARRQPQPR